MKINLKTILITILVILLLGSLAIIRNNLKTLKETRNLYSSTQDSLKTWKDRDNLNHAKISILETENIKDFLLLGSKDKEIIELQLLTEEYRKLLKQGGSTTIIHTETKYDTIFKHLTKLDTIYFPRATILDSIDNQWIKSTFGFKNGNTVYNLSVKNSYGVVIGQEKKNFFSKSKPFVEVINYNPYSQVKSLRTYQVSQKKPSRINVGPYIGYGLTPVYVEGSLVFKSNISIGVGVQYSIINF